MNIKLKRRLLFYLLILSYLLFSYYAFGRWWNSFIGSLLILFFSYLIWKEDFLKKTGLQPDLMTAAKSMILAAIVIICSWLIMKYIGGRHSVTIKFTNWRNYYHDIFYILNEEIVIGAIVLFYLVYSKKIRPFFAAVGLALFFSLIHFVFYTWIFKDNGIIGIFTLLTLFLIGFVRNSLILQTGHIGYSWALHFGWMVIMFGSLHVYQDTNLKLAEYERFNLYLGSVEMVIISAIIAGLTFVFWIKKGFKV